MAKNYKDEIRVKFEEIIIGSILVDSRTETRELLLKHQLLPRDFTGERKHIYKAIHHLLNKQFSIDVLTVSKKLHYDGKLEEIGGDYYLLQLSQVISSSAHLETHIMLLKQYIIQDFWNNVSYEILDSNWDERDVLVAGDNIIKDFDILKARIIDPLKITENNPEERLREKVRKYQLGEVTGVPSGIPAFDNQVSGWQEPDLNIIAGRPGMGKTTLAIASSLIAVRKGFPGAFFSLESPEFNMYCKPTSVSLNIPFQKIKSGQITEVQLEQVLQLNRQIKDSGWRVFAINGLNEIKKKCKELHKKGLLKWVVIDYLQLIKVNESKSSREQEVSHISRELKSLAMELGVPIIALSQLSRGVDNRANKKPNLSDLRESGAIEQDADNVLFVYRPAYYRQNKSMPIPFEEEWKVLILLEKGRDIGVGEYEMILDVFNLNIY